MLRRLVLVALLVLPTRTRGQVYWTDLQTNKIHRANLDGTDVQDLVDLSNSGLGVPAVIALDVADGKMCWADNLPGVGTIQRANLDGSSIEDLVTSGLGNVSGIALDEAAGKMYWTAQTKIQRASLDGTNVEDVAGVASDSGDIAGIALDSGSGKIYWTQRGRQDPPAELERY